MQVKCEYCGSYIEESEEFCKQCGAVNPNFKRAIDGIPKTIAELKKWYEQRNLPPKEVTRFFIGENFKGPRAFGIYEENGEYIVDKEIETIIEEKALFPRNDELITVANLWSAYKVHSELQALKREIEALKGGE